MQILHLKLCKIEEISSHEKAGRDFKLFKVGEYDDIKIQRKWEIMEWKVASTHHLIENTKIKESISMVFFPQVWKFWLGGVCTSVVREKEKAPTSSWSPLGPLDFVLRAIRAITFLKLLEKSVNLDTTTITFLEKGSSYC